MKKLEALFDAVIVKPIENEETLYGNIIVPDIGDFDSVEVIEVLVSAGDQINKDSNRNRILFLGSSITLGWGVDHQDTMTEKLNKMLNTQSNSYEVLNAGIGNYNTVRYVEHYLSKLSVLKPDSIVIQYFVNDAESLKSGGGNWLLRNIQLAVTLMIAFNRVIYSGDESSLINHYRDVY